MGIAQHKIILRCPHCMNDNYVYFIFGTKQTGKFTCDFCYKDFYAEIEKFRALRITKENIIPKDKQGYSYGDYD